MPPSGQPSAISSQRFLSSLLFIIHNSKFITHHSSFPPFVFRFKKNENKKRNPFYLPRPPSSPIPAPRFTVHFLPKNENEKRICLSPAPCSPIHYSLPTTKRAGYKPAPTEEEKECSAIAIPDFPASFFSSNHHSSTHNHHSSFVFFVSLWLIPLFSSFATSRPLSTLPILTLLPSRPLRLCG